MAEFSITDEASLKVWLETRPPQDAKIIGYRTAARVFPLFGRAMGDDWARQLPFFPEDALTAIPFLRPILSLMVEHKYPTLEFNETFRLAKSNAREATKAVYTKKSVRAADAGMGVLIAPVRHNLPPNSSSRLWKETNQDANILQRGIDLFGSGGKLDTTPLWHDPAPDWFTNADAETRAIWDQDPAPWVFWRRWWDGVISGDMPFAPETLRDIALIDDTIWEQGPHAVAAEIDKILLPPPPPPEKPTPLALTYIYDFTRHGETLRLSGVPLDFEGRSEDDIAKCLKKLHDWKDDLGDWIDYAGDALRQQNDPSTLLKAAQKLAEFIDKTCNSKDFAAGRLLTMGGNLRLLAMDEMQRGLVGPTLATMMDARVDQLSAIIGQCFGHVLARLEPLNDLTLGTHDPARLMADIEAYLDHLKTIDPKEVLPLDQEAKAAIADMLRELQEMGAAIAAGVGPKQVAVMQSRFAYRYGALASTLGRALEKGREPFGKTVSRFDEGVKWYKRWETLNNIVDWFSNLPPPV